MPSLADDAIRCGDGVEGLRALSRGSVSLVLTDPPWGATQAKWDVPLDWRAWWEAIDHVLAPRGVASVRLALDIVPLARRRYAYDLVWAKNKASGHLNAKRAPLRAHELILVFGDRVRYEPQFTFGHEPMHAATRRRGSVLYGAQRASGAEAGTTRRYATSVLPFAVVNNDGSHHRIHSTQKPEALLRWFVRAYTQPGDLVVDPTCGSGAAIRAARAEGRVGIGWEIDPETAALACAWLARERDDRADRPADDRTADQSNGRG